MNGLEKRLKALRKAKKMTQGQVADALGLQRSTYTKYETGRSEPTLNTVCKLAALFSVTVDELLLWERGGE